MRTIEPIVRWDVAFSVFCLKNRYSGQHATLSKAVSHTGDGHLYVLIALIALLADSSTGRDFLLVGLTAFAIELPIYWFAKNTLKCFTPTLCHPINTACHLGIPQRLLSWRLSSGISIRAYISLVWFGRSRSLALESYLVCTF